MRICRDCLVPMTPVMSFSREKNEKFNRCAKCHGETRHRKIKDDELSFGEVLNKTMKNRK